MRLNKFIKFNAIKSSIVKLIKSSTTTFSAFSATTLNATTFSSAVSAIKSSAITIALALILTAQADIVKEDKGKKAKFLKAITTMPINVGLTKNIQARFSSLNKGGANAGLGNIVISGTLSYRKIGNYQQVNILWHALEHKVNKANTINQANIVNKANTINQANIINSANTINKVEFTKKPRSELTTDEKRISAPQQVVIEVDEQAFMQAVNKLNSSLIVSSGTLTAKNSADNNNNANSRNANNSKSNNNSRNNNNSKNKNSALRTGSGRNSSASNKGVQSQLPKLDNPAETIGSAIEQCDYRYDIDNMIAHEQQRTNQVNPAGTIIEQGSCLDTTKTFDLVKTYGAPCSAFITTDKAYQSYRITGVIDGEDKIIKGCQADLDNEIAITTTSQGCNTADNINTRIATATYRKYYMLNGVEVEVQQCLADENSQTFAIDEAVCSYGVISANGYSIPQTKLYYINELGVEVSVRGCQASPTQQFATKKIDCQGTNRYEHDTAANTSYLMQRTFVVDTISGTEEQVNDCQRSNSSFTHQQQSCPTIRDDDNRRLLRPKRTYFIDTTLAGVNANSNGNIDTNTNGVNTNTASIVHLSSCDDGILDATPYVQTTTDTAITYIRGDGTSYGTCRSAGGNYGVDGSNCFVHGSGTVLYEAYADDGVLRQRASPSISLSSIPSSVLRLIDTTKRLRITAIAGGGGTYGGNTVGEWGQMTDTTYPNPMTDIAINIGSSSGVDGNDDVCVQGGGTTIGNLVSLTGGRTKCYNSWTSGYSGVSGLTNIDAGSPGAVCIRGNALGGGGQSLCYHAGAGGYVRIAVE